MNSDVNTKNFVGDKVFSNCTCLNQIGFIESLSELTVGRPKTVGSFLRPQNNSSNTDLNANLKNNLVMTDSKATAKSWQDFMILLEEKTGVKRTIRNFDTSEENSVRGSPRRLELVVVRP